MVSQQDLHFWFQSSANASGYMKYIAVVFACFFVASYAVGAGPIPWFITAELVVYPARSLAVSITVFCNWVASFMVAQTFLSLQVQRHKCYKITTDDF